MGQAVFNDGKNAAKETPNGPLEKFYCYRWPAAESRSTQEEQPLPEGGLGSQEPGEGGDQVTNQMPRTVDRSEHSITYLSKDT